MLPSQKDRVETRNAPSSEHAASRQRYLKVGSSLELTFDARPRS